MPAMPVATAPTRPPPARDPPPHRHPTTPSAAGSTTTPLESAAYTAAVDTRCHQPQPTAAAARP
ncbi:hypothetical protein ACLBYD_18440, partial [Rhodococcus sp. C26F]